MDELNKMLENDKIAADVLRKAEEQGKSGAISPEEAAKNNAEAEIISEFEKASTLEQFNAASDKLHKLRGTEAPGRPRAI